jgi:hypothetical protein
LLARRVPTKRVTIRPPSRRGFLGGSSEGVVIAVIDLLTALLSPALQSASQAARCEQGTNNLEPNAPAIASDESSRGLDPIGIWNQGLAPARDGNRNHVERAC